MPSSNVILKALILCLMFFGVLAHGQTNDEKEKVGMRRNGSANHTGASSEMVSDEAIRNYTRNLTDLAEKGLLPEYIGNTDKINLVLESLMKASNKAVFIRAPRGAGKSALVEAVANKLFQIGRSHPQFARFRIYELNANDMTAGTDDRGSLEARIKALVDFFKADQNAILFIDEVHVLFKEESPLTQVLKPALARGEILAISATTTEESKEFVEKDRAFMDRHNILDLPEFTAEKLLDIARSRKEKFQKHHDVKILDSALVEIVKQVMENYSEDSLSRKVIDIMDRVMAREKLQLTQGIGSEKVSELEDKITSIEKALESMRSDFEIDPSEDLQKQIFNKEVEKSVFDGQLTEEKNKDTVRYWQSRLPILEKELAELEKQTSSQERQKIPHVQIQITKAKYEIQLGQITEGKPGIIGKLDVLNYVQSDTGTDRTILNEDPKKRIERLGLHINYELVGQEHVAKRIEALMTVSQANVDVQKGPGVLLHLDGGPGLGKTTLPHIVSKVMRGGNRPPLVISFNQLNSQTAMNALLGADFGYMDSEQGGKLDAIRRDKRKVVVFDEVDKGSPDTWKLLLQILSDGYTFDSRGNKLDFRKAIIITTANWGAEYSIEKLVMTNAQLETKYGLQSGSLNGKDQYQKDDMVLKRIMELKGVPPEFRSRLSGSTVVMNALTFDQTRIIAERLMDTQSRYLESEYLVKVVIDPNVSDLVARLGYDPEAGARSIDTAKKMSVSQLMAQAKINFPEAFDSSETKQKTIIVAFDAFKNDMGGTLSIKEGGQVLAKMDYILGKRPGQLPAKKLNTSKLPKTGTKGPVGVKPDLTSNEAIVKRAVGKTKKR